MDRISLIYKVLSGMATPPEKKDLDEWIDLNDENRSEFDDIKLLLDNTRDQEQHDPDDHFYDGLRKIKERIKTNKKRRKTNRILVLLVFGATLLLVAYLLFSSIWKDKKTGRALKFDNVSLGYVIRTLEQRYHVTIEAQKEILECRFTGTFYKEPVDKMVLHIAECKKLQCAVSNKYTFRMSGACN